MAKEYNNLKLIGFYGITADDYTSQTKSLVENFYDICERLDIPWNNSDYRNAVRQACIVINLLIQSIRYDGEVSEEQLIRIQGIFEEIEKTVKTLEQIKFNPNIRASKLSEKLFLIYEVISSNAIIDRNFKCMGKIFNDYRSLYLIISLVNNCYEDLLAKGFSTSSVLKPFSEVIGFRELCGENISEEDKLKMFLGLVNGTMRFTYGIEPINHNLENPNYPPKPVAIPQLSLPKANYQFVILDGTPTDTIIKEYKLEK